MSREIIIKVRDDLDQSDADETVSFAYRGTSYEIDLSSANAELFDKSMKQFLEAARKATASNDVVADGRSSRTSKYPPRVAAAALDQRKRIRVWANENGMPVENRGIISTAIVEAYRLAHPGEKFHPDTVPPRKNMGSSSGVSSVTAQELRAVADEEGLISAASLMQPAEPRERAAVDRMKLPKAKRDQIRAWAIVQGMDQAPTGQIKTESLEAYYAAHPKEK